MIERNIINQKMKEYNIRRFIGENLKRVGYSHTKLYKTPLGEKIVIYASRPGLVVGRKGQNIKSFTKVLKGEFGLENPQIEIGEIENPSINALIIAEKIATSLQQFGTAGFKGVGHKIMAEVMGAGALGIEILISGKIPGSRAKQWRFYQGYLKKCGDIAITAVDKAYAAAQIKTGTIGIQVRIMPPDVRLPDDVQFTFSQEPEVMATPAVEEVEESEEKPEDESVAEEKVAELKLDENTGETVPESPEKKEVKVADKVTKKSE